MLTLYKFNEDITCILENLHQILWCYILNWINITVLRKLAYCCNHGAEVCLHLHELTLGILVVMFPQLSDSVLTAHIPHGESQSLLWCDCLHIKSYCWYRSHNLVQFKLVHDCCFTCRNVKNDNMYYTSIRIFKHLKNTWWQPNCCL